MSNILYFINKLIIKELKTIIVDYLVEFVNVDFGNYYPYVTKLVFILQFLVFKPNNHGKNI